jgi:UDP-N-acetylmuramate--alanine ligase
LWIENRKNNKMSMSSRVRHIHLVGIGGSGMSGIAEVLLTQGFVVSGSDAKASPVTQHLIDLGAQVAIGHNADLVSAADVVVASTAIPKDNPELQAARKARIPVIPRAEMLAEMMRGKFGIAVAGTHGKTTTTSLVASVLGEAGLDPTYVIGGRLNKTGTHASLGSSDYLVAEADESDASFLYLKPMMAIVTNVDADHMETYGGSFEKLTATFSEFLHHLPFYGLAIVCIDDAGIQGLLPHITRPILSYGFSEQADIRATDIECLGLRSRFTVIAPHQSPFSVTLNIPGEHNVRNALATIAVALELDVDIAAIQRALAAFGGVGRRFQVYPDRQILGQSLTLVDDYGHHPTELAAVLRTARAAFGQQRLVAVFQPHRYTRTRDLLDDFAQSLMMADVVVLLPVYSAGEAAISGADSKSVAQAMRLRGFNQVVLADSLDGATKLLPSMLQGNDVLLTMGAGDIGALSKRWRESV